MSDSKDVYLLRMILEAWDSLPEGDHSPYIVGKWLQDPMAPVMQRVRERLKDV